MAGVAVNAAEIAQPNKVATCRTVAFPVFRIVTFTLPPKQSLGMSGENDRSSLSLSEILKLDAIRLKAVLIVARGAAGLLHRRSDS